MCQLKCTAQKMLLVGNLPLVHYLGIWCVSKWGYLSSFKLFILIHSPLYSTHPTFTSGLSLCMIYELLAMVMTMIRDLVLQPAHLVVSARMRELCSWVRNKCKHSIGLTLCECCVSWHQNSPLRCRVASLHNSLSSLDLWLSL